MRESSDRKMDTDWKRAIELIAGPYGPGDTRESWLARAARRAGISFRQCKRLYYGESADPKHSVGTKVQRAAEKVREQALDLAARYETIAGSLNAKDQAFYSEQIVDLVDAARALRGLYRARTRSTSDGDGS
jgi:hypothetical protein